MSQETEGFFKIFHETVNSSIDDVTRNNFANLESNSKRASYLCSLPVIKNYDLSTDLEKCQAGGDFPVKKDFEKAKQLKDEGNKAVQKGDWVKAMQLYSQSMIYMPKKDSKYLVSNVRVVTNALCDMFLAFVESLFIICILRNFLLIILTNKNLFPQRKNYQSCLQIAPQL